MFKKFTYAALASCGLTVGASAFAADTLTLYGNIDEYFNYLHSSSGATIRGLEDGAFLRSRLGVRGLEDLGSGYAATFQLEMGTNAASGSQAAATRAFDRQSWLGFATPIGEFRFGRQNTAIFYRGDYIDFTSRTLGSIINTFGVPSRYDNDLAFLSARWNGALIEFHFAPSEVAAGARSQAVYQAAADWLVGPVRVGYAGLKGSAPKTAQYREPVRYHNFYANYNFGGGTVYLAYVRSNNSTSGAAGNNVGTPLGNVGALLAGTNPDVNRFYDIYQVSADYRVTPLLRVGALYGKIRDTSGSGRNATGGVAGAYYDLSKRTMLYGLIDRLANSGNGGWRPAGSAGLPYNFSTPADINGRGINGVQLGILHRF